MMCAIFYAHLFGYVCKKRMHIQLGSVQNLK